MAEVNTIKQYDTVKDKGGKRFRVTEIKSDGTGHVVATLKGINLDGSARRGMPRKVGLEVLERDYTRINLAPVEVKKIDDLSEEEREMVKVFGKKDKDAQNENQSLTGLSKEEVEEALTASTFGGEKKPQPHTLDETFEEFRKKNEEDIEILKAELKDRVRENIDLKKTISKMQQQHEAEVADLKDRLMEKEADANAVRKRKDEILKERTEYADALDNDSVAFEDILSLAETIQLVSTSAAKLAKQIIGKTEGRI